MAKIGVERFAAGDNQEYRTKSDEADVAVRVKKSDSVNRIDREEYAGVIRQMKHSDGGDGDKPHHHHRPKESRDLGGPAALNGEQRDQDRNGERDHEMIESRRHELEPFDRRQNRNRRRDHGIAEEHGCADHAEHQHQRRAPSERARGKRRQRKRSALPVVVGAQQNQDVFDGYDNDQSPQDEREHTEHCIAGDGAGFRGGGHRHTKRVKRARADIAIHDTDAAERQRIDAARRARLAVGVRQSLAPVGSSYLVH